MNRGKKSNQFEHNRRNKHSTRLVSTIVIIYGTNFVVFVILSHSTCNSLLSTLNSIRLQLATSNHHSSLKHINEQMIQPNYKRRQHNLYVEMKRTSNGTYVHINTTTPLVRFPLKWCNNKNINNNNSNGDNKGKPNEPKMTPKADTLNWYLNLFIDFAYIYICMRVCVFVLVCGWGGQMSVVFFIHLLQLLLLFLLVVCIWFSCWYIFIIIILVVNARSQNWQQ